MVVVVNDTSVLIDLADMGLLEVFTSLNWELRTNNLIMEELSSDAGFRQLEQMVNDGFLYVDVFDSGEMSLIAEMSVAHASLSIEDCSVWHMAKARGAILLTADLRLRKKALSDGIEVHGVLFVIERLTESNLLTTYEAIAALETLKKSNPRAPLAEINRMIQKFKG